jgi:hypothetical protein
MSLPYRQFKRFMPYWVLLLSLLLLSLQGVRLHVHNYSHEHEQQGVAEACVDHVHADEVHLAIAAAEDHHAGAMSELEITPEGIPSHSTFPLLAWALVAASILLYPPVASGIILRRRSQRWRPPLRYRALPPPLRAPPLS